MNEKVKKILGWAAAVLAFVVAQQAVIAYRESRGAVRLEEELADMRAEAAKDNPGQLETVRLAAEAKKRSEAKLKAAPTGDKRQQDAADMFWGFYFVNTVLRPEYCLERGVDISPFVTAFHNAHQREFAKAQAIYQQAAIDPQDVLRQSKSVLRGMVEQDIKDLASANQMTEVETCQAIADNADAVVPEMLLSKVNPVVHEALLGGSQ